MEGFAGGPVPAFLNLKQDKAFFNETLKTNFLRLHKQNKKIMFLKIVSRKMSNSLFDDLWRNLASSYV